MASRPRMRGVQSRTGPLVLIPAFNERGRISSVIKGVTEVLRHARIVVVDDGSTDGTRDEALKAGAIVLPHPINLGYGSALQTGYRYALKNGYRLLIQMDGDGQHDPRSIPALMKAVQEGRADAAIGSRFLGRKTYNVPHVRRIGMKIFAWIASVLTGRRVTDPTSGFQAINKRAIRLFALGDFPVDYPDADVLVMLTRAGLVFTEVPVVMYAGTGGKSMHGGVIGPLYYVFKMFLSLLVTMLRKPGVTSSFII